MIERHTYLVSSRLGRSHALLEAARAQAHGRQILSPAQAAARELLEETGYRGAAPERLGVVNPNPALFGNTCHTFLIPDARRAGEIQNDGETEETVLELVPRSDIGRRLREGAIDHALVIAAFFWLELARSPERAFV